jgi:hypothetical protein
MSPEEEFTPFALTGLSSNGVSIAWLSSEAAFEEAFALRVVELSAGQLPAQAFSPKGQHRP